MKIRDFKITSNHTVGRTKINVERQVKSHLAEDQAKLFKSLRKAFAQAGGKKVCFSTRFLCCVRLSLSAYLRGNALNDR